MTERAHEKWSLSVMHHTNRANLDGKGSPRPHTQSFAPSRSRWFDRAQANDYEVACNYF